MLGTTAYTPWYQLDERRTYPQNVLSLCMHVRGMHSRGLEYIEECQKISDEARITFSQIPFERSPVLIIGLGPVPFFWLGGWLLLKTGRWVRRGFL
jgi:hypothetical protein